MAAVVSTHSSVFVVCYTRRTKTVYGVPTKLHTFAFPFRSWFITTQSLRFLNMCVQQALQAVCTEFQVSAFGRRRRNSAKKRWPLISLADYFSFPPGVPDFAHDLRRARRGSLLPEPSGERSVNRAKTHSRSVGLG